MSYRLRSLRRLCRGVAPLRFDLAWKRLSASASMLIVGSRGHGGFTGMLLGSVSAACAQHAHCPVLIMRDRGDDEGNGADADR